MATHLHASITRLFAGVSADPPAAGEPTPTIGAETSSLNQ